MVFTYPLPERRSAGTGLVAARDTGKYFYLLCIEFIFALIVALSNMLLVLILVIGGRKLMRNHFYIILANLIFFTSLKCFVEMTFILPYYIRQKINCEDPLFGYFTTEYEYIIFNVSVLADYGVLFFSVLIAVNRYLSVASTLNSQNQSSIKTLSACILVWICSAIIPLAYYLLRCQYVYDRQRSVYYHECRNAEHGWNILLKILIYLSNAFAAVVLVLYCLICVFLRKRRPLSKMEKSIRAANTEIKLLRQSALVFALYTASIGAVFAIPHVPSDLLVEFDLSYAENLLNLSIAAVYPICFLSMSGEMRSVLLSKIIPLSTDRVSSIGSNGRIE